MTRLFLRVLNMSIPAGWLILAVLILRLVFRKAPKWVNVLLWGIGMLLLAAYSVISYWHLRRRVDTAVLYEDNIFQSENISFPFVLGMIKPRIYLPFKIGGQNLQYIVAHEQAHIRRKDSWWKFFGFLLLTIYWFHPLMWLAYMLLCRDIELACDEKVIKELDNERRADYMQALVDCSVNQRRIAVCPLAFGEVGVKERVKSVMNYRKPAFWMIVLAVIACAAVAVCFLTNPPRLGYDEANAAFGPSVTKWFDYLEAPDEMPWDGCLEISIPEIPDTTFRWYPGRMDAVSGKESLPLYSGMPIWNTYFCDLTGDGAPELCSTLSFGSGMIDSRIMIYDYSNGASYELEDRGIYDYTLRQGSGNDLLYVDKRDYNSGAFIATGPLLFADGYLRIGFVENVPANFDDAAEMSCWDFPLNDGMMVRQYDMGGKQLYGFPVHGQWGAGGASSSFYPKGTDPRGQYGAVSVL